MPMSIARLAFGLLVGVMVVPPAALWAQAPSPEPARIDLRTRLPHDTSVYLTWCGTGSMPAGYAGSATQKCFAETDLHLIAEKFIPELARSIEGLVVGQLDPDFPKPAEGEPAPGVSDSRCHHEAAGGVDRSACGCGRGARSFRSGGC